MKNIFTFIVIAITFCACAPSTRLVSLKVLEPAPVSIPPYVKHTGIINRTTVAAETKKIDKIDKVTTLEGKEHDKEGAQESILAVTTELTKNNRFTEVKSLDKVVLKTTGSGVFPSALAWSEVEKICKENNVDALFSLELFDTDTKVNTKAAPATIRSPLGGPGLPSLSTEVTITTLVKTGWRIYDLKGKNILDEYPFSESISSTSKGINTMNSVVGQKDAIKEVGKKAGERYAKRIIPYTIGVSREYFVKGNENFEMAKRKIQTGNWDAAGELWSKETGNTNSKLAGQACHNMAIISEINGDLDKAIAWAQKAYENHNIGLSLRYVDILKNRKARSGKAEQQLEDAK